MMSCRGGVEHHHRPEVQVTDTVRVQRITRYLGNGVVSDSGSHRRNPQSQDVVRKPPCQISLCQTGKVEELRQVTTRNTMISINVAAAKNQLVV